MQSERRRVPLSLQAVFVASNRGQNINAPPPGNVAIRVFQSIFRHPFSHRFYRRTKYTESTAKKELDTTIQSGESKVLNKPTSYHQQQTEDKSHQCESSCGNNETESHRPFCVNYPSASSRSSNTTTIACSVDSEELNHNILYLSPVKYKKKISIKALVRDVKHSSTKCLLHRLLIN
jgi:hypothetical protein